MLAQKNAGVTPLSELADQRIMANLLPIQRGCPLCGGSVRLGHVASTRFPLQRLF